MTRAAILLAGGSGSRVGAEGNKVLLSVAGRPLLAHSLAVATSAVDLVVVVVRPGDEQPVEAVLEAAGDVPVETVPGGATRHASEWSALRFLADRIVAGAVDVVAIHDAARPLATLGLWRSVLAAAEEHGGALPVRPAAGVVSAGTLVGPLGGEEWVGVQTPQAFRAEPLLASYVAAERDGFEGTDTAACVAQYSDLRVVAVPGEAGNLKVTYPEDVELAERLIGAATTAPGHPGPPDDGRPTAPRR